MTSHSEISAFPTAADNGHSANQDGMSLRDYFAAKAMQGFCAADDTADWGQSEMAQNAYRIADAMLKARNG